MLMSNPYAQAVIPKAQGTISWHLDDFEQTWTEKKQFFIQIFWTP
jgi:hypothetical protein